MKKTKALLLSTLTVTLLLSGCGSETINQEISTNNTEPHKVTRAYGNQGLSKSTYANVTVDNSKYFFEYGSGEPHVQVYIDNDLDASTGYNMWEDDTLGAEYLLEDNRLYKYIDDKDNTTWSWELISETGPFDINYYEKKLGFDILGDSFALQVAAIDKDWSRAYISDKKIVTNKENGNNDNIKLTITEDNSNIYFSIKQKDSVKHFLYYIDIDKNKNSGYSTNGAEYLLEDNRLYKYIGDGTNWKWEDKGVMDFKQGVVTKTTLPKSKILTKGDIEVKAYGLGSDWAWVNELDVVSYKVSGAVGEERPFKIKVNIEGEYKYYWIKTEKFNVIYNYNVDCNDDGIDEAIGITGDYNCEYDKAGIYTISISGVFPQLVDWYFRKNDVWGSIVKLDNNKLISIEQWGTQAWKTLKKAFRGCKNMTIQAKDVPNLTNVIDMSYMFYEAEAFNQDISSWDVSNVKNMSNMFGRASSFNQDISSWDVSNVTNMSNMFYEAKAFNKDISSWNISNVTNMSYIFYKAESFNQNINKLNVSNVTNMSHMFYEAKAFNKDISSWNVSNVTNMSYMFYNIRAFNQDISSWDVSNVTNMSCIFCNVRAFNQDISSWDVSNVTNMSSMFRNARAFNQDISSWNVSNVTNMSYMFGDAKAFNQDISSWNVSKVKKMAGMFSATNAFNQDISSWDVSNIINMEEMFRRSKAFNQNISKWNVSNVENMIRMFERTEAFNQDISSWDVSNVRVYSDIFSGATKMTESNKPAKFK